MLEEQYRNRFARGADLELGIHHKETVSNYLSADLPSDTQYRAESKVPQFGRIADHEVASVLNTDAVMIHYGSALGLDLPSFRRLG